MKKIGVKSPNDLHEMIIKKGFTLSSFAKEINVSIPLVSLVIATKRNPSPLTAKKICVGLEKEYDEIFFTIDVNKSAQSA